MNRIQNLHFGQHVNRITFSLNDDFSFPSISWAVVKTVETGSFVGQTDREVLAEGTRSPFFPS